MALYSLNLDCPRCGKVHGVVGSPGGGLQSENGPDRAGNVARLYEGRGLPGVLVQLLNDKVRCERVGDYVLMDESARVYLVPKGGA